MLRVLTHHTASQAVAEDAAQDSLTLDHADRHIRRKVLTTDGGQDVLVAFETARRLRDGEWLECEDGTPISIHAATEDLYAVTARDAAHHAELCWHLGNRHVAAELQSEKILVTRDPVIGAMLRGLGADVRDVTAPFHPLTGAYHHAH